MMKTLNNLIKVIIICFALFFILIGFLLGYLYADDSCHINPLSYGIKFLNEKNDDNIICSCTSLEGKTKDFYFDEEKMVEGNYLDDALG